MDTILVQRVSDDVIRNEKKKITSFFCAIFLQYYFPRAMQTEPESSSVVDSVSAPKQAEPAVLTESASQEKQKKPMPIPVSWMVAGVAILLSILPGLVLLSLFPRTDGALQVVQSLGTMGYGILSILWIGFGVLGITRAQTMKEHPRLRVMAFVKLAAIVLPMLGYCVAIMALINATPTLTLDIQSPRTQAEFVAPLSVTFGMEKALVYLRSIGEQPLKYEWDFTGDGAIDQETFEPSATYVFGKSGIFRVSAVVTMSNGSRRVLGTSFLIPSASFGTSPIDPIIEQVTTFSLEHLFPKQSNPQIPTLSKAKWDFDGDGTIDQETEKPTATFTYHRLGAMQVSVLLELSNNTQTTLKRTVTVVEPPKQAFPITLITEPSTLLGPPPFGVLFTLQTKEPIANVSWDFGNGKKGEGLRTAQVYSTVGDYAVQAIARSQSGETVKLSTSVRVTNPLNINDLSFDGTPTVRDFTVEGEVPLTIDLTPISSLPLISFSWDTVKATESSVAEKTLHAVYRDPGTYFVDLLGIDPDQNVFRRRLKVIAKAPESFGSFTMDPETPIAPATVKFDGSDTFVPSDEITGFEWDFGDGVLDAGSKFSGARMEHLFEKPGTYTVTLRVRTTSGKSFEHRKTLVVRAPILDACFLPSRKSGKAPLGVRFDTTCSTGAFTSWVWDFGDGAKSDQKDPVHVFEKAGNFTVTLTAKTADGRISTKTSLLTISSP